MTRCESYPPCFGTIYFPTAPFWIMSILVKECTIFKIYITKLFIRCTDADIKIYIIFFGDLFQLFDEGRNVLKCDVGVL